MTQVTINGHTYSDDGTAANDMLNGGHRTHFFPLVSDVVTVAGEVATDAAAAASDAAAAADSAAEAAVYAAALSASSVSSVSIGDGSKAFVVGTGKQFAAGQWVKIQRVGTSDWMWGTVTSYASDTLTVLVEQHSGAGTAANWLIGISGPAGDNNALVLSRLSIFSTAAAVAKAASAAEIICDGYTTPLSGAAPFFASNGSIFVAVSGTGTTSLNAASSTDGITWTLRALLGVAGNWVVMSDGSGFLAARKSSTEIAKSTDGITWSAGGVAPGSASWSSCHSRATGEYSLQNGTSLYVTTNSGTSWSTHALPSSNSVLAGNGIYVQLLTAPDYATSATGAAGSWTTRTRPGSTTLMLYDTINARWIACGATGSSYESTDGINWTVWSTLSNKSFAINSVPVTGVHTASSWTLATYHDGIPVPRYGMYFGASASQGYAAKLGDLILTTRSGEQTYGRIDMAAPATGIFEV